MKIKISLSETLTPDDIHTLADHLGIPWDDDPDFLKFTKKVTGKEHLDDLNESQLQDMHDALLNRDELQP